MFDKLLTKLKVKSSEFIRKHSSGLARTIFILVVALICFIPLYIGLLFWWLISPSGFWSVFATSVLLLIVFGSTQVLALIISAIIIVSVLVE